MKEIEGFKETINNLKKQQKDQQEYITQLEDMLPNSKKKKLGIDIPEEPKPNKEEPITLKKKDDNIQKFASTGGTF